MRRRYEISGACIPHQGTSLWVIDNTDLSIAIPAVVPRGGYDLILVLYVSRRDFLDSHELIALEVSQGCRLALLMQWGSVLGSNTRFKGRKHGLLLIGSQVVRTEVDSRIHWTVLEDL